MDLFLAKFNIMFTSGCHWWLAADQRINGECRFKIEIPSKNTIGEKRDDKNKGETAAETCRSKM